MYKTALFPLVFCLLLAACAKPNDQELVKQQQSEAEKMDLKAAVRADNERELRERASRKAEAAKNAESSRRASKE